jgi:hypothetical protein
MIRSVRALWRSAFGVGVLGLTMLGVVLWWLGVITIDVGARFKTSSSQPMISEVPKAPFEFKPMAKNEPPSSEYRLFKYSGTPIDAWVEIEHNGKWGKVLQILGTQLGIDEPVWQAKNSGESPQEKRAEDRTRVTATPAPPPSGYVALVTHLDESRVNLGFQLQLTGGGQNGQAHSLGHKIDLINHALVLEGDQTAPSETRWQSISPSMPAVLNDELTLINAEVRLKKCDREVTHRIRLKVRPSQSARSED